jgi:agmatine/peptidylarginine deiminase
MNTVRRLRAEWEPQSAVVIAWPHAGTDWAADLRLVEPVYDRIALEISRREPVLVLANDADLARHVRGRLDRLGVDRQRACIHSLPCDDTWVRDYGPLAVDDEEAPTLLDFRFNGWGGKFEARLDDRIPDRLHSAGAFGDCAYHHLPWVLEGGAVETDGRGTLLATSKSIVSESRNPGVPVDEMEAVLASQCGISRFLWLRHGGLDGDDTDGHVDTLARFADPATILYTTAAADDTDHDELSLMEKELTAMRTAEGKPYRLLPLPPAGQHYHDDGHRLPATYANFLIVNGAVLAPVYGVDGDEQAISRLREAFTGRDIVPIDCRALIRQNGSLHCATMQLPRGGFRCPAPGQ